MVLRTFLAFDNDNLVVSSSSNPSLLGNGIINNSDTPNGTIFQYTAGSAAEVTVDDTGGGGARFNDDQEDNHEIIDGGGLVDDGTEVESESRIDIRLLDSEGNLTGPTISLYVFSQDGSTSDIWGFATTEILVDGGNYVKVNGSNNGTSFYNSFVTCFAAGTLVETPEGALPVEEITPGQLVWTKAQGAMPVRWADSTRVAGRGALAPVVFAPGALGNTQPLTVSQQHRMWIDNAMAELLFGTSEVLVAAKHLVGLPGVRIEERAVVDYTHFMFDSHQIVRANGALSESFFCAETSMGALQEGQRAEVLTLFPALRNGYNGYGPTAAMTLTASEAAALRPHLVA